MSVLRSISIDDCIQCRHGDGAHKPGCSNGKLLLHEAARKYDCSQLRVLLDNGWNGRTDDRDGRGRTVLHVLLNDAFLGHLYEKNMEECVKAILPKCNINARDSDGETPLSLAVLNGFESCAILLVKQGADSSVRTTKFRRMHSLPSTIAQTMPQVMLEILDSGVTVDYVIRDGHVSGGEPEVKVKLDWSPILQYCQIRDNENENKLMKHKHGQRETSFLYSFLDVPISTREQYLKHPLVSAFLYMKSIAVSRKLRWFQIILAFYPVFYMLFIYFLYFNHCKFEDKESDDDNPSTSVPPVTARYDQNEQNESTSSVRKHEQLCDISLSISLAAYALMLIVCGFGLVEVYAQFLVDTRYLKSWRTWVLRATLLIMGVTLWPALQWNTLYNITWQYPFAALGTFFAWVMFLIQMEMIPQVKIYLEMLVSITLSVLKITLLFMPLLIGFYMGFNLMFFEIGGVMNFILMTVDVGSDEYEEMIENAKDSRAWFTIIAYVFSIAFIIVIAIVFMNFLLGVSINDIQELKRNAKIVALSNRIQKLFIIDLVFPTHYNVVPEGQKSYFLYGPYDGFCKLPDDVRRQITLLLKSKNSNESNLEPLNVKSYNKTKSPEKGNVEV